MSVVQHSSNSMTYTSQEDKASLVQTTDGMTFVVVAQLVDEQGPSSGVARFTLPSYAPLHDLDAYESTWIVALNRIHVSLRRDKRSTRVASQTSDLQGACSTTAEENYSLSSGKAIQSRAVSESSQESDNGSTPPSTAPTTPLTMNFDSLKLLPPRNIKQDSLSPFILSLDLHQSADRIGGKNCYSEEAEAQRKQRALLDALDFDLSKKQYRKTFASYLLGHRIGPFPQTWTDCQDVAALIPGIYKKLPNLRRYVPNDLKAEYDQARLEREEEYERAPNKDVFLRGVVEWRIMCNASGTIKAARFWSQRTVIQKADRSMNWLLALGGTVKAPRNAVDRSVTAMEGKTAKPVARRSPHHYSFSGRAVYHKSNTPLAVSFWATQSARLKNRFPEPRTVTLRHVLAAEAARYVDPYLWYGPANIPNTCGTALQEYATGFLEKTYSPEGTWMNDKFSVDEDVPRAQLEDSPHYDAGVADVVELPVPYFLSESDGDFAFKDGGRLHMYGHPKKRKGLTKKAQAEQDQETGVPAIFPSRLRLGENVEYPVPSGICEKATQISSNCTPPITVRLPPTPVSVFYGQHGRLIGYGYSSSHLSGEMALPPTIRTEDAPSSTNADVQPPAACHVRKNRRRKRKNKNHIVVNLPLSKVVDLSESVAVSSEAAVPEDISIQSSEVRNVVERTMSAEAFEATLRLELDDKAERLPTPSGSKCLQSPRSENIPDDQASDREHSPVPPSRDEVLSSSTGAEPLTTACFFPETGSELGAISTILDASCPVEAAARKGSEEVQPLCPEDDTSRVAISPSSNAMAIESSEEQKTIPDVQFSDAVEATMSPVSAETEPDSALPPPSHNTVFHQPEHTKPLSVSCRKCGEHSRTSFQRPVSSLTKAPQSTTNITIVNIEGIIATPATAEPRSTTNVQSSKGGWGLICPPRQTEHVHLKPAIITLEHTAEPSASTGSILTNCLVHGSIAAYIGYRAWKSFKR